MTYTVGLQSMKKSFRNSKESLSSDDIYCRAAEHEKEFQELKESLSSDDIYCWAAEHEKEFQELKESLSSDDVLAHFVPGWPTKVIFDGHRWS